MNTGERLVVVGMISNGFTKADPDDPGRLDVVGFDTDHARGKLRAGQPVPLPGAARRN